MAKRSLLAAAPVQIVLSALIGGYMKLVKHTVRWEVRREENVAFHWNDPKGVVLAFWHGRLMGAISAWPIPLQPVKVLVSRSAHGDLITRTAGMLGVGTIRGSSRNRSKLDKDKGGSEAYRNMVAFVAQGGCMGLTPDGPRGPRYRAAPGAARLAVETGVPVLIMGWSTRWRIVFNSWDRVILPLPFSRGVIVWGEPVIPARDMARPDAIEEVRRQIEENLIEANHAADLACGVRPIEPAQALPVAPQTI